LSDSLFININHKKYVNTVLITAPEISKYFIKMKLNAILDNKAIHAVLKIKEVFS
jgi:hypothetical protein